MLKQLSVSQKILGAITFLFAWSSFTTQASADVPTGTITFLSDRDEKPFKKSTVYLIDADGLNEKSWKTSNWRYGPVAWSPDGKYIAYHLQEPQDELIAGIWLETPIILDILDAVLKNLLTSRLIQVTAGLGGHMYLSPKWSPDGKWLALTSTNGSPDGMTDVCIIDIEGNQFKNLTRSPGRDEVGSWSPDGSKIVFSSNRDGNGEIYVMGSNGRKQVNLTNHPALDAAPTWSPDGTRIAFHSKRKESQDDIYVMNPDGADIVNLTRHPWEDRAPAWSPNGRWIAFHSFRLGRNPDIYVMDANGGNRAQLTKDPGSDTNPTWVIPDRSLSVEVSSNQATLWGRMKLERQ